MNVFTPLQPHFAIPLGSCCEHLPLPYTIKVTWINEVENSMCLQMNMKQLGSIL
jgi:hypothetical protein